MLSRRGFLLGAAVMAAPAIVRPGLLMPVKPYFITDPSHTHSVDGVSLFAMEHPEEGAAELGSLSEQSLLRALMEGMVDRRYHNGLRLRPTHLLT